MAQAIIRRISSLFRKFSKKKKKNSSKLKTKRRTSFTKKRASSLKRKKSSNRTPRRTETVFGMQFEKLMGPTTPNSLRTPSPKDMTTPNSTTPDVRRRSNLTPYKTRYNTPIPQSTSPENVRITPTGPGFMGPNINCYKNKTEEECNSTENCKWDKERGLCNLKPPELGQLTN